MEGKAVAVFRELLRAVSFPQVDQLIEHFTLGFPLIGMFPETGVFPQARRDPLRTEDELKMATESIREEVLAATGPGEDPDMDTTVYEATMEEVKRGWLTGPLTISQLSAVDGWIPSKRFGVRQGEKVRCIDDYALSRINSAHGSRESINPADIDAIASNCRAHADALVIDERLRPAGSPFEGCSRHPDHHGDELVGRLWDVSHAYKHLAVHPKHQKYAVVVVWCPQTGRPEFFLQRSLPFGASASVLAFNWIACAIQLILAAIFMIGCTNFYDDYFVPERRCLADSAATTVEGVFDLLGWGLKSMPDFSSTPAPLGAIVDLTRAASGIIVVANKPERIKEIRKVIGEVTSGGTPKWKDLERIRGRLLFARSLCFGRFGSLALRTISACFAARSAAPGRPLSTELAEALRRALRFLAQTLEISPAREIRVKYTWPLLFFTDGAYEASAAQPSTVGGVLLDFNTGRFEFYAAYLEQHVTGKLLEQSDNPILEIEMIGVLLGLLIWLPELSSNPVIGFNDNDAVKGSLISGTSASKRTAFLLEGIVRLEAQSRTLLWWERVPSDSNPADAPSRGKQPGGLAQLGRPRRRSTKQVGQQLQELHESIRKDNLPMEDMVLVDGRETRKAGGVKELSLHA